MDKRPKLFMRTACAKCGHVTINEKCPKCGTMRDRANEPRNDNSVSWSIGLKTKRKGLRRYYVYEYKGTTPIHDYLVDYTWHSKPNEKSWDPRDRLYSDQKWDCSCGVDGCEHIGKVQKYMKDQAASNRASAAAATRRRNAEIRHKIRAAAPQLIRESFNDICDAWEIDMRIPDWCRPKGFKELSLPDRLRACADMFDGKLKLIKDNGGCCVSSSLHYTDAMCAECLAPDKADNFYIKCMKCQGPPRP